ncbi:MAG: GAF domain-containing protein [Chloroflexota bacterium]|nr:MAG: GAF domain-containing protein [Chloroflexota bacterium]
MTDPNTGGFVWTPALRAVCYAALRSVRERAGADMAAFFEWLSEDDGLVMRAQNGWTGNNLVDRLRVKSGDDSLAGYAVSIGEPVIVADLRTETRFRVPAALLDQGAITGVAIVVGHPDAPLGVIATHWRRSVNVGDPAVEAIVAIADDLAVTLSNMDDGG